MKRISKESVEKMQQTGYLWYWQTNIAVGFLLKVFWMSFLLGLPEPYHIFKSLRVLTGKSLFWFTPDTFSQIILTYKSYTDLITKCTCTFTILWQIKSWDSVVPDWRRTKVHVLIEEHTGNSHCTVVRKLPTQIVLVLNNTNS